MSLLECRDIAFGVSKRLLCSGLHLTVEAGDCVGVLGPNGSGKTTLLLTLAGLHPLTGGEVWLQGRPLGKLDRGTIARAVGLLFQDSHDPFPATVMETALLGRHPHLGRWQTESVADRQRATAALKQVELEALAERQVQTLSGGERRRLAFATLLTQAAPLMLLDEPLNHLDLRHQQLLLGRVRELTQEGHGVMMVLHDPNQAMHYCNRVLLLSGDGRWEFGKSDELLDAQRLSSLYGCRIESGEAGGRRWFHCL